MGRGNTRASRRVARDGATPVEIAAPPKVFDVVDCPPPEPTQAVAVDDASDCSPPAPVEEDESTTASVTEQGGQSEKGEDSEDTDARSELPEPSPKSDALPPIPSQDEATTESVKEHGGEPEIQTCEEHICQSEEAEDADADAHETEVPEEQLLSPKGKLLPPSSPSQDVSTTASVTEHCGQSEKAEDVADADTLSEAPAEKMSSSRSKTLPPTPSQAEAGCAPMPETTEWIVDMLPNAQATQADARLQCLCSEVSTLSKKAFGEDVCTSISAKSKWRLTVLTGQTPEGFSPMIGFVVYKLKTEPKFRCLCIAKIAVHPDYRKHGFGSTILAWCVARAKAQKEITSVKLCALAEVVSWYRKRGFVKEAKLEDDEDHVAGQVAMSKYLPARGKPAGKMRRR
mmetsp:Transcript_12336/g.28952  ORF Transcript_12336/g.28952 Transcript_12336/m.28952 type:complete len:400 (-) Transcript_12336:121-1320(-)